MMRRNTLNYATDLVSTLVVLGLVLTGLIMEFVLPPGRGRGGGGGGEALWSYTRHDWGDVHFWLAVAGGVLLVLHVALHWQWVCLTTQKLLRRGPIAAAAWGPLARNVAGSTLVILLTGSLAGFTWVARQSVSRSAGERGRGVAAQLGGATAGSTTRPATAAEGPQEVRGSITLAELAAARGVAVPALRATLHVPADAPADERLGRLARQYDLSMDQFRQWLGEPDRHADAR